MSLNTNIPWWAWVVAGMVLTGAEIFIPSFVVIWFGCGAFVVGALLAWWNPALSISAQITIWALASVGFLAVWFALLAPRLLRTKSTSGMSREAFVGQRGTIVESVRPGKRGRIQFTLPVEGESEWPCLSATDSFTEGEIGVVVDVEGNTLVVAKPGASSAQETP